MTDSAVFFLASAIYVAPHIGETYGIASGLICLAIGWYSLFREANNK